MEIVCPDCGARENYQLADGRRKCRACRRKFTLGGRKRKLAVHVQQAVREAFWEMQPASEVADALQINRKTVQKMYGEFRQMMKRYNHRQRAEKIAVRVENAPAEGLEYLHKKENEFPMFYLVDCKDFVAMYLANEFVACTSSVREQRLPVLMVYRHTGAGLLLDPEEVFRRQVQSAEQGEKLLVCLTFMLEKMKPYRGVPSDRSLLYAEEMIFRFNCRVNDSAWEIIASVPEQTGGETLN